MGQSPSPRPRPRVASESVVNLAAAPSSRRRFFADGFASDAVSAFDGRFRGAVFAGVIPSLDVRGATSCLRDGAPSSARTRTSQ